MRRDSSEVVKSNRSWRLECEALREKVRILEASGNSVGCLVRFPDGSEELFKSFFTSSKDDIVLPVYTSVPKVPEGYMLVKILEVSE